MREQSAVCRLSFILPDRLYDSIPKGPQAPCLHGCLLTVHGAGLVSIEGKPLGVVVEEARRFLRRHRMASIAATLIEGIGELKPVQRSGTFSAAGAVPFNQVAQLKLPGITDAA